MTEPSCRLTLSSDGKLHLDGLPLPGLCHVVILKMVRAHQYYANPTDGSLDYDETFGEPDEGNGSNRKLVWNRRLLMLPADCLKFAKSVAAAKYWVFDMPSNSETNYAMFAYLYTRPIGTHTHSIVTEIEPVKMPRKTFGVYYHVIRPIRSKAIQGAILARLEVAQ